MKIFTKLIKIILYQAESFISIAYSLSMLSICLLLIIGSNSYLLDCLSINKFLIIAILVYINLNILCVFPLRGFFLNRDYKHFLVLFFFNILLLPFSFLILAYYICREESL